MYCDLFYKSIQKIVKSCEQSVLLNDTTISASQKENLLKNYDPVNDSKIASFISDLLLFVMERKFVKREADKKLLTVGEYSPSIGDFIFENDVPAPCRFFCGRDTELTELHEALISKNKIFLYGVAGIGKSELAKAYARKYKKEYNKASPFRNAYPSGTFGKTQRRKCISSSSVSS